MNRRRFLRCLGGAALSLPVLEACDRKSGTERTAAGRSAFSGAPAKRFIGMGVWDGIVPNLWFPTGTEKSFQLATMMTPLAKHQANMLVLKGVDNAASRLGTGLNGHAEGVSSLLSGIVAVENPVGSNTWIGQGQTIDQAIADTISKSGVLTRFKSLELGVPNSGGGYGALSYSGPGQNNDPEASPDSLFALLFQDANMGADAIKRARARRISVLDGSIEDYQRLSKRISGEDRRRVEAHLQALRELEMRLAAAPACDPSSVMGILGNITDNAQRWRAFIDLSVLALSCDLTRVITFSFDHAGGGGDPFPWLGVMDDVHELSHSVVGQAPNGGPETDRFVQTRQWFASELAYFVEQLKGTLTPEGDSLFDATVIFQGSEISFNHNNYDLPVLIMAGDKTPIDAGRYVNVMPNRPLFADAYDGVPHNHLLTSMLHAFGASSIKSFGAPEIPAGDMDAKLLKA